MRFEFRYELRQNEYSLPRTTMTVIAGDRLEAEEKIKVAWGSVPGVMSLERIKEA